MTPGLSIALVLLLSEASVREHATWVTFRAGAFKRYCFTQEAPLGRASRNPVAWKL